MKCGAAEVLFFPCFPGPAKLGFSYPAAKMGNTDSGAFRIQNAATDAGVGVLGGIGNLGSSPNMLLIVGGGVLLLVLIK